MKTGSCGKLLILGGKQNGPVGGFPTGPLPFSEAEEQLQFTVRAKFVECFSAPEVAVMVTV